MEIALGDRINKEDKAYRRILNTRAMLIGIVVLIAELAAGYVVLYQHEILMGDAMSRTANAYYVLNIQPAKLASIGFVWNPLPSLLQLPILLFTSLWKPLATVGYAGAILTAVFAAINAGLIFRYLQRADLRIRDSVLITGLYAFNPFIFYYGFNGMSETLFFTSLIVCTSNLILWADDRHSDRLVIIAMMLAMAFLVRYETFPWGFACGLVLIVIVYAMEDRPSPFNPKPFKMNFDYLVASGTVIFLPVVYTVAIWIFLNWTILGDPLYFLSSTYSNASQSATLDTGYLALVDTPFKSFVFGFTLAFPFLLPFFVIAAERFITKRMFRQDFLILVLLIGSLFAFHWLMLYNGSSFGWLRFFSFSLPIALAWFPYELTQLKPKAKKMTLIALCCSLVLSGFCITVYFQSPHLSREEYPSLSGVGGIAGSAEQIAMAEAINQKYSDATILLDSFTAAIMILNLDHPENLITNTSDEFDEAVIHPLGQEIEYLMVPNPDGSGRLDALITAYPGIYYNGTAWLELVVDVKDYKLYRILEDEYYQTIRKYGVLRPGKTKIELPPIPLDD